MSDYTNDNNFSNLTSICHQGTCVTTVCMKNDTCFTNSTNSLGHGIVALEIPKLHF